MSTLPRHGRCVAFTATALALAFLGGCKENNEQKKRTGKESPSKPTTASVIGPDTSAVPIDMSQGWCAGHGVPESVCTRCAASPGKFKEAGDWCQEHDLPESQCLVCHPEVAAEWAKLDPANQKNTLISEALDIKNPKEPTKEQANPIGEWCTEHGVPESVCTRCDASLIEGFKDANDWCGAHGLPESQCTLCNPEVKTHWDSLKPRSVTERDRGAQGSVWTEPNRRILTGNNDSQCQVDRLQIRFLDGTTARKAGIETERVRTRRLSNTIECLAEVGFDQTRLVRITPRIPGVVTEALVEIGDLIEADDLLAVLESPTLGQAKSRYIRVREGHLLAKADFKRRDTIYRGTQRMLQVCTAATPSNEVRRELTEVRIGNPKSRLLQAHAELELARSTMERERMLLDKQISSEQSFEKAKSNLASTEAGFDATREAVAFDNERDHLAAMRTLKVAKSELDAVARELHILGLTESHLAKLGSESGAALSRYELHSPATGHIIERRAVVGEVVEQRDALYTVADLSTMWVMMDLRERDLTLVRVGLPVLFTVDGLPGHAFDGTVSWISATVDDRSRTVKVRANVPNERSLLRANMFGLARIIVHDNDEVVSIPSQAVQTDGCCQLVFVKQDETLFTPRKVSLGASAGGHVEILAGLAVGESVVTVGSFLMKTEILKSNIGAGCCDVKLGS